MSHPASQMLAADCEGIRLGTIDWYSIVECAEERVIFWRLSTGRGHVVRGERSRAVPRDG